MTPMSGEPLARDLDVTAFSQHLDGLLRQAAEIRCAIFVDGEGETVDLSSRVDPFDARIAAAEAAILLHAARWTRAKLGEGEVLEIRIEGGERSILARHVSHGYDIVLVLDSATVTGRVAELAASTAHALCVEGGLKPPSRLPVLRAVEQRPSRMGFLVPTSFEENGVRRRVEVILGHRSDGENNVRFLVRLEDGEELVLHHERDTARWVRG